VKQVLFTPWAEEEGDERPLPPVEMVGGKGWGLYWLAANGFPTPPTWVLSTAAFDMVVQRARLTAAIAEVGRALAGLADDWATAQQALEALEPRRAAVAEALRQTEMPDRVGAALADLPLAPEQWAVRSSATVEDDPHHSFAGQFLSLLSVPKGIALWDAIREVWDSTFGREALMYCAQHTAPLPRMAVVLQPMEPVTARDRSGVAFSHSPVEMLPGVLVQVAFGTGQVVVDGYGGDIYSVQGEQVQIQPMPPSEIRVTDIMGYTVPQPLPPGLVFTEEEVQELARLALAVAERWGGPVNVEFVWRVGEGPTLVQVRSAK
jgi:phosphoenolpyruvate synthase/pyruvate phosphate dikinase